MDQSKKDQAASNTRQRFDRDAFWEPVPHMTPEMFEGWKRRQAERKAAKQANNEAKKA